jgi:GMP synthase (glutamine-hydrolysing)
LKSGISVAKIDSVRKVLVFQHVAHEILGTLNPLLKEKWLRVRYVNFERTPDEKPSLDKYNGLIVLGGYMGVYESHKYTHIKVEMRLIEQALKKNIPVLGICLGSQMLAHALGADVRKSREKEIGWCDVHLTEAGAVDPCFAHFKKTEKIFQLHGDTFDVPKAAVHLASSKICAGQAFRYGEKAYGLQFHLEVDQPMIKRWLRIPANKKELESSNGQYTAEAIEADTAKYIAHSVELSQQTFARFIDLFGLPERPERLGSEHGKPR